MGAFEEGAETLIVNQSLSDGDDEEDMLFVALAEREEAASEASDDPWASVAIPGADDPEPEFWDNDAAKSEQPIGTQSPSHDEEWT